MKRIRQIGLAVLFLHSAAHFVHAQKESVVRNQTWLAYLNQPRISNRSGLWIDLHLRMTDNFFQRNSVSIARLAYTYYLSEDVRLQAGYAYVTHFSQVDEVPDIGEHRPWQQIQWMEKKNSFSLMQWLRLEERWRQAVTNGQLTGYDNYSWRFRYNFSLTLPLKGKSVAPKTPFLFFSDELHINAGRSIINNYFDQNRLFLGLGYQFTEHINAHAGYLYVFQQLPSAADFVHINAIRIFVFHNLDLRKSR